MELIESHLDTTSDEFKANDAHQRALAAELKGRLAAVKLLGLDTVPTIRIEDLTQCPYRKLRPARRQ